MKIATQNYWHVSGPSFKQKNRVLADFCRINQIDILCIQEGIGGLGNLIYGTTDSIADLARMMGYHHYAVQCAPCRFWPTWLSYYSIGIISRYPLAKPTVLSIGKRRHLVIRAGDTVVCTVHVDPKEDTEKQIRRITTLLSGLERLVIAGDFNHPGAADIATETAGTERQPQTGQIDFVLWKGFSHSQTGMIDLKISDHPLVWAALVE